MTQKLAKKLSQALHFDTTSYHDTEKINFDEYRYFISFLMEAFPSVRMTCDVKLINDYALIFHYKTGSTKKPILFLAHYDVVPVGDLTQWKYPPFSGTIAEDCVWGRGALDCKHQLIVLMQALENIIEQGQTVSRDIYFAFGFDEEIGGENGAKKIAAYFAEKNIQFEMILDEGGVISTNLLKGVNAPIAVIGVAEKGSTSVQIDFKGEGGHSSMPPKKTSINTLADFVTTLEKRPLKPRLIPPVNAMFKVLAPYMKSLSFVLKHMPVFFPLVQSILSKDKTLNSFIRTTFAATMTQSGTSHNVLPMESSLVINMRILQGDSVASCIEHLKSIGNNETITITELMREEPSPISPTDNDAYRMLGKVIQKFFPDVPVMPYLMAGATDARHYAQASSSIYRFAPVCLNAEEFGSIHSYNERISLKNLETMLNFYSALMVGI